MKKEKGITLIALVVTIVVLLILAAVSIGMLTGENGIIKKAQEAKKEDTKGEIKEELEMDLGELTIKKKGQKLERQEILEKIGNKVEIIDTTDEILQGEYKGYGIIIDENNKIIVGEKLTGAKPTAQIILLDKEDGIEKARLQVIASIEDGEIQLLESKDGLVTVTENSNSDKIYEVKKNGKYRFKITGTNKRASIVKKEVTSILTEMEAESILEGLGRVDTSGLVKMKVKGKTSSEAEEEITYRLDIIKHDGSLVLDGVETPEMEGITLSGKTYSIGKAQDIGTASEDAKNTVVLKVDGDLTIDEGVAVTSIGGTYGGPKGMIVYCTGTLTNNGTINMSARGAKAVGENVYLLKNKNVEGTFEYIPAVGGAGGSSVSSKSSNGRAGGNAPYRGTGGGGSGAVYTGGSAARSPGAGTAGTSYSGGSGGGGTSAGRKWWSRKSLWWKRWKWLF